MSGTRLIVGRNIGCPQRGGSESWIATPMSSMAARVLWSPPMMSRVFSHSPSAFSRSTKRPSW